MPATSKPWYAEGLRFECTRCGACCRGEGYVWVDAAEVARLAEFVGMEPGDFGRRYLRLVGNRLALVDGPTGACVFWENGCTVYPVRPGQCRTFPFWREHVADASAWEAIAQASPGVKQGRHYSLEEIERLLAGDGAADAGELSDRAAGNGLSGKESS